MYHQARDRRTPIRPQWVIVMVDMANPNPRLIKEGRYRALEWRPKEDDTIKGLHQNCRYIPDVVNPRTQRRLKVRPEKADATIKRAPQGFKWLQHKIDLRKQGLVGLFNFVKQHQISQGVWRAFKIQAKEQGINTHSLDAIEPF
jgi:hypothetical protein